MNELELFAGAGGGILGSMLLGHRTVCAVEYDAYARSVLLARQNDGTFPPFPVWDDVRTFDGKPWRGIVDCVSGGFPCQDISAAGKGAGIEGERSGLWKEMARIICEVRPRYAFIENSPMLVTRGLDVVLSDLAAMGFDARWGVLSCRDAGGVHLRERMWIIATNSENMLCNASQDHGENGECEISEFGNSARWPDASDIGSEREQRFIKKQVFKFTRFPWGEDVRSLEDLRKRSDLPEPLVRRIGHDVAFGSYRLKAIGNGQVPRVRAAAWSILNNM